MTPRLLRSINSQAVLQLLRDHSPCSCADLARLSGLSAPTVASSVALLESLKLVTRLGNGPSSGGRPPTLLEFNSTFGYVVGMEITATHIRTRIADLNGACAGEREEVIGKKSDPRSVVKQLARQFADLRSVLRIPAKRMLTAGVSAPGITDVDAGVVTFVSGMTNWEDVPLAELVKNETGLDTVVENDVNLSALAERWHGIAKDEKNFAFVSVGRGVGAGLFINGELFHGPEWTAGEIGYLYAPANGTSFTQKSRAGALETSIGSEGIEAQWLRAGRTPKLSALQILDLALTGDADAVQIVQREAAILAAVCTTLSLVINCPLIVMGGELGGHESLFRATASLLERNEFARPRLVVSPLGRDAALTGAVRLALQRTAIFPVPVSRVPQLS